MGMTLLKWLVLTVVYSVLDSKGLFGKTVVAKQLLDELLDDLAGGRQIICLLFFSCGRRMLLLDDSCGHLYFVD